MANQTGRPIAPARKLVAAVLGTIAIFVMVFGLGLSSWAIVALGAAMLALAIALGMVTVARRGARAWVAGYGQVKAISEPPTSTAAYGRAELQLVVVVSGLPTTEVLVRESRVPVAKWPLPGDQLPITVDVDDMRRVRIAWDQASDRADDGDPPPPPAFTADDDLDDDLLADMEPPPWQNRDREWGRGPDEPPPPAGVDPDDPRDTAVVVRETPAGPILEGQFVDHADSPPPLPHRAPRAADQPGRPPGTRPSPRPHRAAGTATAEPSYAAPGEPSSPAYAAPAEPDEDAGPTAGAAATAATAGAAAAATAPDADEALRSQPNDDALPAEPAEARGPQTAPERDAGPPPPDEQIDLPLDGDPEPPPEVTDPDARHSVETGVMAPPPAADADPASAPASSPPDTDPTSGSASPADAPTITGLDTPPPADPAPSADVHAPAPAPATDSPSSDDRAAHTDDDQAAHTDDDQAAHIEDDQAAHIEDDRAADSDGTTAAPDRQPADAPLNGAHAAVPEQRSGLGKAAAATVAAAAAAAAGFAATRRKSTDDDTDQPPAVPPQPSAAERDNPDPATPRQRGPWADLEGGYEPDERTDEVVTAYPSARPGPSGAIHGVGLTIAVTDLPRSVGFYRDMLGFFEIDRGADHAILASGDTRLVLHTGAAPGGGAQVNLEVGDVAAMHDELAAKGVRFDRGPHPVTRGDRLELWAASFPDPDGNPVAITQWRAVR